MAGEKPLVLLDYATNADPGDLTSPLSHAALVKYHLEGAWPKTPEFDSAASKEN
jgi:hypothetical protein